jgi:hypothetical protein
MVPEAGARRLSFSAWLVVQWNFPCELEGTIIMGCGSWLYGAEEEGRIPPV